jgi:hypothetical protein
MGSTASAAAPFTTIREWHTLRSVSGYQQGQTEYRTDLDGTRG